MKIEIYQIHWKIKTAIYLSYLTTTYKLQGLSLKSIIIIEKCKNITKNIIM